MSNEAEQILELANKFQIDSRLKGYNGLTTHPVFNCERTYCIVCGREHGWVSMESAEFIRVNNVIVICEECEYNLGTPDLVPAPIVEMG